MTARTLLCIMDFLEAKKLNMKILGSNENGVYAGKALVQIGVFIK